MAGAKACPAYACACRSIIQPHLLVVPASLIATSARSQAHCSAAFCAREDTSLRIVVWSFGFGVLPAIPRQS